jgi:malate dehydrogenase (oxaloacetate-decarboxylating)(NADP+)
LNANVLQNMASINRRPIISSLSNPKSHAECKFEAAMTHTNNLVLFAASTAFLSYKIPETGEIRAPGQGNHGN